MDHTFSFVIAGLTIAAMGALVFFGGTKLIDRQGSALGGLGSCLLALLGVMVIFTGVGILAAAFLLP